MKVFVEGAGLVGPGLNGWQASLPVLAGTAPYIDAAVVIPPGELLPSAERRRTGLPVKIALAVGCEAIANAQRNAAELPAVFASSAGDGENMHAIFEMLANNGREVSPTRFHNSVHNAPSGYWSIATKSMAPSTSLACYDESFVAGLVEAATQVASGGNAVVLIAYDTPYPAPLHERRPISAAFGVALVLTPDQTGNSLAMLDLGISRQHKPCSPMTDSRLEALRMSSPAARSLPLLAALAGRTAGNICFDYVAGNRIDVAVQPC
ncbi:MAG: beta-ketoacyl synthase chain length factor [Nitrosomonadales bacterium]|nr:beta-ketoacyl synthase chain length factor [Nitrosomonadales bacterium]